MNQFTGTGRLVRLALRRDRIKLPAWIIAITGMLAINMPAIFDVYGKTEQTQLAYAATTAPSLISRIFGGPIAGPQIGEIVMNEIFLFWALAIAFMSTLLVVRHTRQNEETGRAELISSAVVGRNASLTAALAVAFGANVAVALISAAIFKGNDFSTVHSLGAGAALGAVGVIFALVAAITSQISESARGANSQAATVIGVAFMLRAIGDGLAKLTPDNLGVTSAWPSWLSPIGWMQQMHALTQGNWDIFGLFAVAGIALVTTAYYLNSIRDMGLGMIPARKGPAHAKPSLMSAPGLAWRLQYGVLRGWVVGIVVMGLTIGLVSKEFGSMLESNPDLAKALSQMGGSGNLNDIFFSSMFSFMGIALAAYGVQALQRMRTEETAGRLEPVLAAAVGKPGWVGSHILCACGGILLLFLVLGITSAATYILANNATWSEFWPLVGAAFAPVPAVLVLASIAVLAFGLLPSFSIAISWCVFALCFLLGQFGALLKLPQAVMNLSPFTHIPAAPAEAITFTPLAALCGVALLCTVAGLAAFRKRDITTS